MDSIRDFDFLIIFLVWIQIKLMIISHEITNVMEIIYMRIISIGEYWKVTLFNALLFHIFRKVSEEYKYIKWYGITEESLA